MVTPETSGSDEKATGSARWKVPVALLTAVAGVATVFALTKPDPPPGADATTTTTPTTIPTVELPSTTTTTAPFRVADVVSGPQINWVETGELKDQGVVTVLPRGDDFYLFTAPRATYPDWHGRGLGVWRLQDNSWLLLSTLPAGFAPDQVLEAGDGFLAFGTEVNGAPVVWISPDGTEWDRIALPWDAGHYVQFDSAVANDDSVVLGASTWKEPSLLVAQAVAERYPRLRGDVREYPDREPVIVLTVPPFIPVVVVEPEELGLTPSDVTSVGLRETRMTLIGTDGGHRWRRVVAGEDDGTWIIPAFKGPDDMIWGRDQLGDLFRSPDGLAWERAEANLPDSMTAWGSDVVGVESYDGRSTPRLQTSTDLVSWEDFPVPDVLSRQFGRDAEYWDPVLAAGDGGVAVAVRSTERSIKGREPLRIERDGYTLFLGPTGLFLLRGAIPVIQDWEPDSDLWVPARMTEDGMSVIFSDPATRADLVTFSLEELEAIFAGWNVPETVVIESDRHVLFFSPDGEIWTVQDLSGIAPGYGQTTIAVGTESILLITSDFWSAKVWVGQLPATP